MGDYNIGFVFIDIGCKGNLITADWQPVRPGLILTLCWGAWWSPAPGHSVIRCEVTRGDHWSPPVSRSQSRHCAASSRVWPDLSSRSSWSWSRVWYISPLTYCPAYCYHLCWSSCPDVFVSDHCNHHVISPRNCAVLSLPYLHPISPNNGKCVSCRVASSRCPCVFSYSVNVGQTAFSASNSPWSLVTTELPHSEFTFRFVCLWATNVNDIHYKWSICIELEW